MKERKENHCNAEDDNKSTAIKDLRSIFKKISKDDLLAFTFEEAHDEMKKQCPLFYAVLMTASIASQKSLKSDLH